jgi:hypothetical protein
MKLKIGDKVYFRDGSPKDVFIVYEIYSKTSVSLGLKNYPDVEQDEQVDIKDLIKL